MTFLEQASARAGERAGPEVRMNGPIPAPMERRAGRYRAQLLIEAPTRGAIQRLLAGLAPELETLPGARRVRWSLDVDPQEML